MSMKAVLPAAIPTLPPCIVKITARTSFAKVTTTAYCGREENAGDGVAQVPDHVKCCAACEDAIKRVYPKP